jgi:hypothetical protein
VAARSVIGVAVVNTERLEAFVDTSPLGDLAPSPAMRIPEELRDLVKDGPCWTRTQRPAAQKIRPETTRTRYPTVFSWSR